MWPPEADIRTPNLVPDGQQRLAQNADPHGGEPLLTHTEAATPSNTGLSALDAAADR